MQLITEQTDGVTYTISESAEGQKNHFVEGIFMQSEIKNRNGRIYPKSVLEKPVDTFIEDYVKTHRAVGELNHPEGPSINLDKVSHIITEMRWDGNDIYGKAKILDTPMGLIVKELIKGGCQLGVSSRGLGSVSSKGGTNYVDDYVLKTVDIVQDPSAPSSFVNGIMEGIEYLESGDVIETASTETVEVYNRISEGVDRAKVALQKMSKEQSSSAKVQAKMFKDFIEHIKI